MQHRLDKQYLLVNANVKQRGKSFSVHPYHPNVQHYSPCICVATIQWQAETNESAQKRDVAHAHPVIHSFCSQLAMLRGELLWAVFFSPNIYKLL